MGEFLLHGTGENNSLEKTRKQVNRPDQDQIVHWPCIGNDEAHSLEPKLFECLTLTFKIFHGVVRENTVGFEVPVQFEAGQAQHLSQIHFGDAASPQFFERECFERTTRQVTGHHNVSYLIRNLKGDFHQSKLTCWAFAVNVPAIIASICVAFSNSPHQARTGNWDC
jgi:hypothetical protein